jgi:hypothetical protein
VSENPVEIRAVQKLQSSQVTRERELKMAANALAGREESGGPDFNLGNTTGSFFPIEIREREL